MAKRTPIHRKTLDKWLTKASLQLQREDYPRVILTCQRVLRSVADNDPRRAEALRYLGTAHAMKSENQQAFAEKTFRDVIALGDVLPQPWGNLGVCLLMQHRYDEAEEALQRALEIDAGYKLAQTNLAMLKSARSGGIAPRVVMSDPFAKAKRSIDFL